ncbi:uncharacterized protein LOC135367559 [Ornithodoros turicata]|uniref:uncharacterized protein LOC135367559 n=1 Tax=Ornithodoros turicata TaxID=34597 RepID=UPI0031394FE8
MMVAVGPQEAELSNDLEHIGIQNNDITSDQDAVLQSFKSTVRNVKGLYEVYLPWKICHPDLPSNKKLARRGLRSLTTKLLKSDNVLAEYDKAIRQYLVEGHAGKVLLPATTFGNGSLKRLVPCRLRHAMSFEKVLHDIGGFGVFNRTIMAALVILGTWHTAVAYFSHLFVLLTPSGQWCFVNGSNVEYFDLAALPHKMCQIVSTTLQNDSATSNIQETCVSGWIYDKDEVFLTLTMENGWVCGNSWKLYSVHVAFWIGSGAGYLISGLLADKWAPESSSWLISTGRSEEALGILERIAKLNRRRATRESISTELQMYTDGTTAEEPSANEERSKPGFWKTTFALVATPRIRRVTLMMFSAWFLVCMCYNVNQMELGRLGLDVYSTYSIAMALELPVSVFCLLALDRLGRRWPNVAFMLIGGAVGITDYLVHTDSNTWQLIMTVVCMMAWAGSYNITYQLASEVFPTVIRGRGVLLKMVVGDIGSCLGTQVAALAEYDRLLPTLALGIVSLVGTVTVFFLPETVGLPLPQTVEDGEEFGKDQGLCFCPVFASRARTKRS